jgi:hypothetical protein
MPEQVKHTLYLEISRTDGDCASRSAELNATVYHLAARRSDLTLDIPPLKC